ncbi:MAG: 2-oxoacid:ferredoxin oxidoreductase subunit beta [Candidatus Lindowbacteria bacterium]|nr:2-oxoacid:ferredoxin oxidoreductase subunit beta [Candidatus Lindowbacteria bacterium]
MQSLMPKLGIKREDIMFVSGIGCSSRFPYYMNTYGFHSIHGRAPAFATGIKMNRPELSVWIITGDGDALSIGGNHLMHIIRRNMDVKICLFNNRIYGLTKGQYSPTSVLGQRTKSSPTGSLDYPIHPIAVALAAEATFVARTLDADPKHMLKILDRAAKHKGTAFVEIYQNCNIFNDGAHSHVADKKQRPDNALYLEQGEPLRFGREMEKGIKLEGTKPVVVENVSDDELLVHDYAEEDPTYAFFLARMRAPDHPVPLGVFREVAKPPYNEMVNIEVADAMAKEKRTIQELLNGNSTWVVE